MLPPANPPEEEGENDRLLLLLILSFLELFRPPLAFALLLLLLVWSPRPAIVAEGGAPAETESEPGNDDDDDDTTAASAFSVPPKEEGPVAAPPLLLELRAPPPLGLDESAAEVDPLCPRPPAWLDRFPRTVLHAAAVPLATLPHTPPPPPLVPLAASPFAAATVDGDPGLLAARLLVLRSLAPPLTVVMNDSPAGEIALLLLRRQVEASPQVSPSLLLLMLVQRSCCAVPMPWSGVPAGATATVGRHVGCEIMRFLLLASTAVSAKPTVMTATHASASVLGE